MPETTIYSTPTCVYCKMAKEFFKKNNIQYTEKNVAEDEAARSEMLKKSGQMGVPVITVGDSTIVGFDAEKLSHLLGIT